MTLDRIARAFLDALAVGESDGTYNELYGGGRFEGYDTFPQWAGKDNSHAAGRYQFEPKTWEWVSADLGLTDFSPASQDAAAWFLAQHDYKRRSGNRDLHTDLAQGNLALVPKYLKETWTSLNDQFAERFKNAMGTLPDAPAGAPTKPVVNAAHVGVASAGVTMLAQVLVGQFHLDPSVAVNAAGLAFMAGAAVLKIFQHFVPENSHA
jgi:muramidase (phage lysozyme)